MLRGRNWCVPIDVNVCRESPDTSCDFFLQATKVFDLIYVNIMHVIIGCHKSTGPRFNHKYKVLSTCKPNKTLTIRFGHRYSVTPPPSSTHSGNTKPRSGIRQSVICLDLIPNSQPGYITNKLHYSLKTQVFKMSSRSTYLHVQLERMRKNSSSDLDNSIINSLF